MNDLELCKKILTGIFSKNNELRDIDDSIFIQLIRAGIEEATKGNSVTYDSLLEHAMTLYTTEWLKMELEDEENLDWDEEKTLAREEFLDYWNAKI